MRLLLNYSIQAHKVPLTSYDADLSVERGPERGGRRADESKVNAARPRGVRGVVPLDVSRARRYGEMVGSSVSQKRNGDS